MKKLTVYRVWCKGIHPYNKNFQTEGWWNLGDYILNKYYPMASIMGGSSHDEFFENFEICEINENHN